MNAPQIVEHSSQRILTSAQLAKHYESDVKHINDNFQNNRDRYTEGKHYYSIKGDDLKAFLDLYPEIFGEQNQSKMRVLYLWTEKGALMHAKSINTDQAWHVYEDLVDNYYRKYQERPQTPMTSLIATEQRRQIALHMQVLEKEFIGLQERMDRHEIVKTEGGMTDEDAILILQGIEEMVKNEVLGIACGENYRQSLQFCLRKAYKLFQKITVQYAGRDGRIVEYPPDGPVNK